MISKEQSPLRQLSLLDLEAKRRKYPNDLICNANYDFGFEVDFNKTQLRIVGRVPVCLLINRSINPKPFEYTVTVILQLNSWLLSICKPSNAHLNHERQQVQTDRVCSVQSILY